MPEGPLGTRTYTAGQVARVLGVAETTLRSWHRRYAVGPVADRPGGYRRYTAADVVQLETMRDLIRSGMLASDAAKTIAARTHGGHTQALRERLVDACRALDSRSCRTLVAEAVQALGVAAAWDEICRPALQVAEADVEAGTQACIPQEHTLSWAIAAGLHQVASLAPLDQPAAVLLACTDAEQHTLPLEVLAAALAERQVPVRMLGAAVPASSLLDAVRATSPEAVVLWAHRPETASPELVRRLRRARVRALTAGPGWSARRRASDAHLDDLTDGLRALTRH